MIVCLSVCVSVTDFVPRQNLRSAIGVNLVFFLKLQLQGIVLREGVKLMKKDVKSLNWKNFQ